MNSLEFVRDEILAIRGYVSGEQPPVGKFIKLNTNENPFPPSNSVIKAIQQAATQGLNVYPDALANSFRICAAQMLGLEKDWILCGNGSDDLLTMLTRTFVSSGSTIRIPYPSYVLYRTLGQIQGARTEEIHFEKDWRLPSSFYENSSSVSLVFLPNPNSPSGTIPAPPTGRSPMKLRIQSHFQASQSEPNCILEDFEFHNNRTQAVKTMQGRLQRS